MRFGICEHSPNIWSEGLTPHGADEAILSGLSFDVKGSQDSVGEHAASTLKALPPTLITPKSSTQDSHPIDPKP